MVLGIPRGGATTANIIAKELSLPFGIVIVQKIGQPTNSEHTIAAISESGMLVKNKKETDSVDREWFVKEAEKQLLKVNNKERA